ncbi:hypothetical protein GYMLUDRAFT_173569, partial [Collybiopsis luxurians FD-317 M1]
IAVFIDETASVGRGIAEAFAHTTRRNAHIIHLGRNEAAIRAVVSTIPKPTLPGGRPEFIRCDATLLLV